MVVSSRPLLGDLSLFLTIARRGSFRDAGRELGLTTSALSHAMKKLETRLGVRLINRTQRAISLTVAGAELADALSRGLDAIEDGLNALEVHSAVPTGHLRLNVPHDAALLLLAPVLERFALTCPGVHLDLVVDDRPIDLVAEGFDAGIRFGALVPKYMIALPLTPPLRWVVAAAPAYLAAHGRPRTPADLHRHACIQMRIGDTSTYPWELGDGPAQVRVDVPGTIRTNDSATRVSAVMAGLGLGYFLELRIADALRTGQLEVVMPDWSSMDEPYCMYYASRRQPPPGLRQLIGLIRQQHLPDQDAAFP
ncbi:LysR family transcriptional regulator [Stenotrophomonas sp. 24(2023)]|uniref:LysR family transcriptional regulator n=1 Tax=Stenotrophomonas sp. 24(2023) TaxID=3068324 RepID=UPI0027E020C1|nr:LysR family transcriptional regulator [Stenotrophomonas sp. 24(2023)]WMJ70845.1 LysR family transcriptional regulator [Stenotrophomonas sp. 24(2023)]